MTTSKQYPWVGNVPTFQMSQVPAPLTVETSLVTFFDLPDHVTERLASEAILFGGTLTDTYTYAPCKQWWRKGCFTRVKSWKPTFAFSSFVQRNAFLAHVYTLYPETQDASK